MSMNEVTAAVIIENGSVLLTRRRSGEHLAGYWEFPGGKIEPGESPQRCLEREIVEELGIRIKAGGIITESAYTYDHGAIKLVAIESKVLGGTITLSVHDAYAWVPLDKILDYDLAPADIPVARKIMYTYR